MIWPGIIFTDRLVLRRPVAADAAALLEEYGQDQAVVRYLTWRPHASVRDTLEFLAKTQAAWDAGSDLAWALTLRGDDRLIGMIGLRARDFKHDIGYVLARRYWGRGLMSEAARTIVDLALSDPLCHRVWAVCDADNRASARVMEKAGMSFEGVLHRWIVHPNISSDPRDVLCYARVRSSHPERSEGSLASR